MATILLRLAALVVATACATGCGLVSETPPWMNGQDADAQVADATPDNGAVGSDTAAGSDIIASTDAGGGTDSSVPDFFCPTPKRPQAVEEMDIDGETTCLTLFEKQAFELLAASKGVPMNGDCEAFVHPDYCYVDFTVTAAQKGGVFAGVGKIVKTEGAFKFEFQTCDETTGICSYVAAATDFSDGKKREVIYNVLDKTLIYIKADIVSPYDLVPK